MSAASGAGRSAARPRRASPVRPAGRPSRRSRTPGAPAGPRRGTPSAPRTAGTGHGSRALRMPRSPRRSPARGGTSPCPAARRPSRPAVVDRESPDARPTGSRRARVGGPTNGPVVPGRSAGSEIGPTARQVSTGAALPFATTAGGGSYAIACLVARRVSVPTTSRRPGRPTAAGRPCSPRRRSRAPRRCPSARC